MNGQQLHDTMSTLFPIMRSITGAGVRESLQQLSNITPIQLHSIPTGTPVLDWSVPEEWRFKTATLCDSQGNIIIDSAQCNLHVVNYSIGTHKTMTRKELEPHLFSLPDYPKTIPYRTTYYKRDWGICLSHEQYLSLGEGPFTVHIDAQHIEGELNYGEILIPGKSDKTILVSTHICHPSLANDNLSGMVLAAALAKHLRLQENQLTWRFVFVPGTIGAISWLHQNRNALETITAGFVLTGLGDASPFTWKEPEVDSTWTNKLAAYALQALHPNAHTSVPFSPYGYDERQYCSPGFKLPVGRLSRAVHGTFPEYHTSDDNLEFVKPEHLESSLALLKLIAYAAENDFIYENQCPYGEPQLGRRGLYSSLGAQLNPGDMQMAMLWVLNQSDGINSLVDIAARSKVALADLITAVELLKEAELLTEKSHASESVLAE